MRHAKAEPGGETDAVRELAQRGWNDALAAGRWLAGSGITPDAALVSSARRTRSTWLAVAEGGSFEADATYSDSLYTAGRRGVGGTVLAEKICGAAAAQGKSLAEVTELCQRVNGQVRSMGMALTPCITPGAGTPSFELGDDEMEIGIGIHGEPGRERLPLEPAAKIVERLTTPIVEDLPFSEGDKVLAFVNGMGGTPLIELYIVYNELNKLLQGRGITIDRNLIGNYITSLEMAGCSITLLKLDDELTALWDAPVDTIALRWS